MTKICPNCKTGNKNDAGFCQNCGEDLSQTSKATQRVKTQSNGGIMGWWNKRGTGSKAAIGIAGICCIGLILIVAFYGFSSPDKNTATTAPVTNVSNTTPTTPTTPTTSNSSSSATGIQVQVIYDGSWTGNYGDVSGSQSVDGSGSQTYSLTGSPSIVSVVFQKSDGGSGTLTANILQNGQVVETKSTSAAYGVVSVSHSF